MNLTTPPPPSRLIHILPGRPSLFPQRPDNVVANAHFHILSCQSQTNAVIGTWFLTDIRVFGHIKQIAWLEIGPASTVSGPCMRSVCVCGGGEGGRERERVAPASTGPCMRIPAIGAYVPCVPCVSLGLVMP